MTTVKSGTALDQARSNVVRFANSNMLRAYWMIGHEIVQELQAGQEQAADIFGITY